MEDHDLVLYISIFLVSYILTKTLHHKFHNLPPSPSPALPILGHIPFLLKNRNSAHRTPVHRTLFELSHKHGPVLGLQLGALRTLLVSSPSAAEDCLHHNDIVFANRPRLITGKIFGYNYTTMLSAPYGPLWRNHRRIASTEILSPHRLHMLANIRSDEVRSLIHKISQVSIRNHEQTVEIKQALFEMINNIMMRMIAGKRYYGEGSLEGDEAKRFQTMVTELQSLGGATSMGDFFPWLKYLGIKLGNEKRYKGVFEKMDKFYQDLVDEQRRKMVEGGDGSSNTKCLLEVLLDLQKTDPCYFTDDIIKGLVQVLLLAGTETSASTIEWALALLLNNPEVLIKAQKEIDDHVKYGGLIKETDLARLPYLHCIINETLRMYPAAPVLPPHESSSDCTVGGYNVRRGTMLLVNVWAMHNDPKVWDEPRLFKPERFESFNGVRKLVGHKFMPFGSGRRACPGENFAVKTIGLTLGSLIQCFDWKRVGGELVDMEEKVGLSLQKAKPLEAKCIPRDNMIKLLFQDPM